MLEDVYPLTPLQEGLYYHWLSSSDVQTYSVQMSFTLKGSFDEKILEESYAMLIARHAILRTSFTQDFGERPLQVVRKDVKPVFHYADVSDNPDFSTDGYRRADQGKGFNLNKGSQMRLTVLYLGENTYEFIWTHHHILMDGWCLSILTNEFFHIYYSRINGAVTSLKKIFPYSGYIKWLNTIDKAASLNYWQSYLSGYETAVSIPRLNAVTSETITKEKTIVIDGALRQSIKKICQDNGITENTFIQTTWGLLLARYNNTNDVVFGAVVSGRAPGLEGVEEMIGLFINTVPVRIQVNESMTLRELFAAVQRNNIASTDHHYIQLADIQSQSIPGRNLFDHILVFENYPVQPVGKSTATGAGNNQSAELQVLSMQVFQKVTYDFRLTVSASADVNIEFSYNAALYDDQLIKSIANNFLFLIEQVTGNMDVHFHQLNVVHPREREALLEIFGSAQQAYPKEKNVVQLFEEQVKRTPDNIALIFGPIQLSYRALNETANRLGSYLRKKYEVHAGDRIAIKLDRSEKMIIAIWGVLKSGAAYVPIEPDYPEERISYMLADSNCKLVIDAQEWLEFEQEEKNYSESNLDQAGTAEDLAYVIYTSGSTGRPKGVMIKHISLVDYCYSVMHNTNVRDCRGFGLVSTIAADLCITVIFIPLINGATLYVFSAAEAMDAARMQQVQLDYLKIVPSHWKALQGKDKLFAPLKCLMLGGEDLKKETVALLIEKGSTCHIYNEYGPTETTVGKIMKRIETEHENYRVSIGRPMGNTRVYILDDRMDLAPIGAAGEICIGGDGLSPGYINKEQLTAERFVQDPFRHGERIYRTGDAGRWLPDGNVDYRGRRDEQVKIRGYRVEPGEIEKLLLQHEQVEEAVVVVREDEKGEKRIITYMSGAQEINIPALTNWLSTKLPKYMLPHHYRQLDRLPLTTNGKVDKKSLPVPEEIYVAGKQVAPRTATEEKLARIWSDVLGINQEKIGINDNFFESGGHSLMAIQVVLRIREQLQVEIDINKFFDNPSIEQIATQIENVRWLRETAHTATPLEKIII